MVPRRPARVLSTRAGFFVLAAQPAPSRRFVAATNTRGHNLQALTPRHIGDAADVGRRQIHARSGLVAHAQFFAGKICARLEDFAAGELDVWSRFAGSTPLVAGMSDISNAAP